MGSVSIKIDETADLAAVLNKVDLGMRMWVVDKALKAAGKIVAKDAKRRVPQSR